MAQTRTVHATAIVFAGQGVLIRGRSGAGKSALALELLAFGAALIADDQVVLTQADGRVTASCPAALSGMIEARGFGILRAIPADPAPLACVVDLDLTDDDRLPARRSVTLLGCRLPLIHLPIGARIAPALLQFLRAGLIDE